jgi:hypothetical protein
VAPAPSLSPSPWRLPAPYPALFPPVAARQYDPESGAGARGSIAADDSIVMALKHLREVLQTNTDLSTFDNVLLVRPFVEILRHPETTGPVTSEALAVLHGFLQRGVLSESPCAVLHRAHRTRQLVHAVLTPPDTPPPARRARPAPFR